MSVATSKVQKWGNSLGVRIAKHVAEAAGVHEGSVVELRVEDGTSSWFRRCPPSFASRSC